MPMEIVLLNGEIALVDDEDYLKFSEMKWSQHSRGYPQTWQNGCTIRMHEFLIHPEKGMETDHINRNPLDNRKSNLRIVNRSNNQRNKARQRNNKTGLKGVSYEIAMGKYRAQIKVNGETIWLGRFVDKMDAACAYNEAAQKHFREFAYLNFI